MKEARRTSFPFASGKPPDAAGVLFVEPGGLALFMRRTDSGEWAVPAGGVEADETAAQAAAREAAEETGCPAKFDLEPVDRRLTRGVDFCLFAQQVPAQFAPILNGEHDDYVWAPLDDPPMPLHPGLRATLDTAWALHDAGDAGEAFDPAEARDPAGKWTAGAASASANGSRGASGSRSASRAPHDLRSELEADPINYERSPRGHKSWFGAPSELPRGLAALAQRESGAERGGLSERLEQAALRREAAAFVGDRRSRAAIAGACWRFAAKHAVGIAHHATLMRVIVPAISGTVAGSLVHLGAPVITGALAAEVVTYALVELSRKLKIDRDHCYRALSMGAHALAEEWGKVPAGTELPLGEGPTISADAAPTSDARMRLALGRLIAALDAYGRNHGLATDADWDESKHPRVSRGSPGGGEFGSGSGSETFVSPNTRQLSFAGAYANLHGARQLALIAVTQEIHHALGLSYASTEVLGAWADGAENSVLSVAPAAADPALVRAAAAMSGYLADQKQVMVFQPAAHGDGFMATFGAAGDLAGIHRELLQDGLAFHTLEPTQAGAIVHIFGTGQETLNAVGRAAERHGQQPQVTPGHGEFIGTQLDAGTDREQRDDAKRQYAAVIERAGAAAKLPSGRALDEVWQDIRSRWRALPAEDRLTVRGARDDFDEAKHPRAAAGSAGGGEFVAAGGGGARGRAAPKFARGARPAGGARFVSAYHGTTKEVLDNIKRNGLLPHASPGADKWAEAHDMATAQIMEAGDRMHAVYMVSSPDAAAEFARIAAAERQQTPLVLELRIPAAQARAHMRPDERVESSDPAAVFSRFDGAIKPEWIVGTVPIRPHSREISLIAEGERVGHSREIADAAAFARVYLIVFDPLPAELA